MWNNNLKKKNGYDLDDFVDTVKMSNAKKNVAKLWLSPLWLWIFNTSQYIIRKQEWRIDLKDVTSLKVQREHFQIQYTVGHDLEWQELGFLPVKIYKNGLYPVIRKKYTMRGISSSRKAETVSKLVPLMPEREDISGKT